MIYFAECTKCGWSGDASEIVSKTDAIEDLDFIYCPYCGSSDIEYTEEEDD